MFSDPMEVKAKTRTEVKGDYPDNSMCNVLMCKFTEDLRHHHNE